MVSSISWNFGGEDKETELSCVDSEEADEGEENCWEWAIGIGEVEVEERNGGESKVGMDDVLCVVGMDDLLSESVAETVVEFVEVVELASTAAGKVSDDTDPCLEGGDDKKGEFDLDRLS